MATLGIEMCDAGFAAAACDDHHEPQSFATLATDWPGFAYFDGERFHYGRGAEDQWFIHPRRVGHTFWARLAHEPSTIGPVGKPAAFSELAFHFFEQFVASLTTLAGKPAKVVLAVPGAYLKDEATEDEKIGLVLGMAAELGLPLAGVVDMGCAALCDSRASGFNPTLPVVVVDLHLEGTDLTLVGTDGKLERRDFIHLPNSGGAHLLKHLTATMGNRFLRHTAFDILEDGRIEQTFFRQTKDFFLRGSAEHRYQINTSTRGYEMIAKREQLVSDAQAFVSTLVQAIETFVRNSAHGAEPCTIALSDRAAHLPGLEARLRTAGFSRLLRLPAGAAACGAARLGETDRQAYADPADVPVDTALPIALARRCGASPWEARLQKLHTPGVRPTPTHVVLDGIGHPLGSSPRFTIGVPRARPDLSLPEAFGDAEDCSIPIVRENGRLWFVDVGGTREPGQSTAASRLPVEAGDRLTIRCGTAAAEVLFAHFASGNGARHD